MRKVERGRTWSGRTARAYDPGAKAAHRRGTAVPRTRRRVAAVLAAVLVSTAGCVPSAEASLPRDAYGTWDCSYFEPFTVVVGEGTFEWTSEHYSVHGTWQLDRRRVIIDQRIVVEGVPDTVEGAFMLQMLVSHGQTWAVDVIPADDGRRVELFFPDGRVTCTKRNRPARR
jgi:hypothetical protein